MYVVHTLSTGITQSVNEVRTKAQLIEVDIRMLRWGAFNPSLSLSDVYSQFQGPEFAYDVSEGGCRDVCIVGRAVVIRLQRTVRG